LSFDALFQPLAFQRGPQMKNRFMLAPLTNQQSHADGRLSDAEIHWLLMRAEGGFGLVMTAASHVQPNGQGFAGQLGVFSDDHIPGLRRLAEALHEKGALAAVQLHHAGMRSDAAIVSDLVSASADEQTGARALTTDEVETLRDAYIAGAVRAETAGFDGAEIHGAHGYILTQFLSEATNRREDRYGGSFENRCRLLFEIIDGVRAATGPNFQLGLRLSPERFGLKMEETLATAQRLFREGKLDYLDMSLWDVFKTPEEDAYKARPLCAWFAGLERGQTRLGAAGKIRTQAEAQALIDAGYDFVLLGRAAILHHDFPNRTRSDPAWTQAQNPVSPDYLAREGVSPAFVQYLRGFPGFVSEPVAEPAQ
jgi:2,4-dienoyl-CoA reductase-like NADH-dependent reductase (Old Yellow Enzyme family)